jgi:hypothetical protein
MATGGLVGTGGVGSRVWGGFGGPAAEQAFWGRHVQRLVGPQGAAGGYPFVDRCLGGLDRFECACLVEQFASKIAVEPLDLAGGRRRATFGQSGRDAPYSRQIRSKSTSTGSGLVN